jgi:hypothetical protein
LDNQNLFDRFKESTQVMSGFSKAIDLLIDKVQQMDEKLCSALKCQYYHKQFIERYASTKTEVYKMKFDFYFITELITDYYFHNGQ